MPAALELISSIAVSGGGSQRYYRHESAEIKLPMRFSVFVPPQAEQEPAPVLFYLAGLTCTEETFMIKAGARHQPAWRQRAWREQKLGSRHWRRFLPEYRH